MKRREFILIPAKALGGLVLYSLVGELIPAPAEDGVKVPLRFFTAGEAQVVQAACARIFPSDESGPGATEAGVVVYIDRQLASPYGRDARRYTKGPWVESVPEHGYQGKDTPQQTYRAGIPLLGADFAGVSAGAAGSASGKDRGDSLLSTIAPAYAGRDVLRSTAWREHGDGWLEVNWLSRTTDELPGSDL